MDSIIYKVIFRAHDEFENKSYSLSFANLNFEKPLIINTKFILDLKKISEIYQHIVYFQNIEEVLIIGNPKLDYIYNYFIVILYTNKANRKKEGYLVSNVKNFGDIILGFWPFNDPKNSSEEKILETTIDIISNPNNYSNVCIISQ